MKTLITQPLLDDARAQHVRAEFWDSRLTNFFVQVRASGRAFFYIRYRPPGCGKYRSFHFSSADVLTVKQARDHARHLLAAIALGDDPAQARDAEKQGLLLRDIVASHYLPHIRVTKKSWQTDEILLRCHVLPVLGDRPLVAICKADLAALLIRLRSESHLAPATCNRAVVILRYLYNLCLNLWQIPGISHNPASHLPLLPVHNQRQTFLGVEQLQALITLAQNTPQNPHLAAIITLLALTGVRRGNVLRAQWQEFDEAKGIWHIPMTKSGRGQDVWLSAAARQLLLSLPSRGQSPWLFPNPKTGKPYVSIFTSWNHLRQAFGMPELRLHDLRHTFASLLIESGSSLYVVQRALGHHSPSVTMRYAHLSDHAMQQAFDKVGEMLPGAGQREEKN